MDSTKMYFHHGEAGKEATGLGAFLVHRGAVIGWPGHILIMGSTHHS